jgi:diaminohydroxyphosphoribosylaminopyrimidine deaminase/5-amino-6-(5-phosphoribosylamino)uracil reductase
VVGAGIRRVVFAMLDPFPQVAGQGAARLREAGIVVEVGTGEAQARRLNAPYLKRLRTSRPWVHAKWAMTLDGKIATAGGESKWITGEAARAKVHELRGRMDAVIVGRGTLLADDPLLTARPPGPRTATRVVLSATGEGIPHSCRLLDTVEAAPVLVFTTEATAGRFAHWAAQGAEVVALAELNVKSLLTELGSRGMTNVLVEGGAGTLGSFRDAGEIDEVHAFISPKLFGGSKALTPVGGLGVPAISAAFPLQGWTVERVGDDLYVHGLGKTNA